MNILNDLERYTVIGEMAKEFLVDRLGVEPTDTNIKRFALHILQFEREVRNRNYKNNCSLGVNS